MVILAGGAAWPAKRPVTFMRLTGLPVARFAGLVAAVTPSLA